jgi:DNA-binding response OmpR family regulator
MMSRTILVVDDEYALVSAMMIRLNDAGYRVIHAGNGLAGLDAARKHAPDAIVLDIGMPGMDGIEVCRRLAADEQLADTPVIFVSGRIPEAARRDGFDVTGHFYLTKPLEAGALVRTLELLLPEKSNEEAAAGPPANDREGTMRLSA